MIKKQVIDYLLSKSGNLDSGETWYDIGKRFGIKSPDAYKFWLWESWSIN